MGLSGSVERMQRGSSTHQCVEFCWLGNYGFELYTLASSPGGYHGLSQAACMQWATMVVIEQMQRWRCPTYTPRTTIIAPYSSTEVVHALPEAEKFTLLFFRCV